MVELLADIEASAVEFDDVIVAMNHCYDAGWTDGLPVIPPTTELVAQYLGELGWDTNDAVAYEPVRGRTVTAEKVVANAIMAGCLTIHLPVVRAALEAMSESQYVAHGTLTSTGGATPYVIVNGPIRITAEMNFSGNLFGPGSRANSTIGRAIRLVLMNCFEAKPGTLDRSTQGNFGKYSGCFAENEEQSPWPPFHTTRGADAKHSTVTVFAGESGHNILIHGMKSAEQLLDVIADAMRALGSFSPGESLLVLAPEHAHFLGREGWSRRMVQEYLFEHAVHTLEKLKASGKLEGDKAAPHEDDANIKVHRGESPDDIYVLVGGGDAGGHSAFFPSWSRIRGSLAVTQVIDASHTEGAN